MLQEPAVVNHVELENIILIQQVLHQLHVQFVQQENTMMSILDLQIVKIVLQGNEQKMTAVNL